MHLAIDSINNKQYAHQVFNPDGTINDFHKDNFLNMRLLKFKYTSGNLLYDEYRKVDFFKTIKHTVSHPISDLDNLKIHRVKAKQKRVHLAQLLHSTLLTYADINNTWSHPDFFDAIERIRKLDELTFEVYRIFGLEYLEEIKYDKGLMVKAVFENRMKEGNNLLLMVDRIIAEFSLDVVTYCDDAKDRLQEIYENFGFEVAPGKRKHAKASDLENYFECKRWNSKKKVKGEYKSYYILYRPKDKIAEGLKFLATDYFY